MPPDLAEPEKRLWDAADELRANELECGVDRVLSQLLERP